MCQQVTTRFSCGHVNPTAEQGCTGAFSADCPSLKTEENHASDRSSAYRSSDGRILCHDCIQKSNTQDFQEKFVTCDIELARTKVDKKEQLERSRAASRKDRGKVEGDAEGDPKRKPKGKGPEKVREKHQWAKAMRRHWR